MNTLPFEKVKRKLLFKRKATILDLAPRTPEQLLSFGIINVDKPSGPKSIHVVNEVRAITGQQKCGHAGTLDPITTGVLPVGLGKALKVLPTLSVAGKVYKATMKLHAAVEKERLEEAFKKFTGKIIQTPPRVSAVARRPREREIYWAEIESIKDRTVVFEMGCQHGTYVRKWISDLGQSLGIVAHMSALVRLQAGPLKIKHSVTMEQLKKNFEIYAKTKKDRYIQQVILPPEECVQHLPQVYIDDGAIDYLKHGSPVFAPGIVAVTSELKKNDVTAIFDTHSNLLAIGIAEMDAEEILAAKKGLAIKTDFVVV
ncbi:MAG: RNA-guided pseudouridylation complex pseudouridine synthase subunit Cbf5 [DPANN group archaeon]|nr:RNA-guided pseudouridylation complex pseudouridine synthase subunit Cbf5 [DPANN group archaeon]